MASHYHVTGRITRMPFTPTIHMKKEEALDRYASIVSLLGIVCDDKIVDRTDHSSRFAGGDRVYWTECVDENCLPKEPAVVPLAERVTQ